MPKKPPSPRDPASRIARGVRTKTRVKTRDRRSVSSARWLQRQLNDPYVVAARSEGYHSRAAFKLTQMQAELKLFKPGMRVVDLGAAPGGWTQVLCDIINPGRSGGRVIALDYLDLKPVAEAQFIKLDFTDESAQPLLKEALGGKADAIISDMAPPTVGHRETDHIRIMLLAEAAYDFALGVLKPGGTFLAKMFQGGSSGALLTRMKKDFTKVKHVKPPASRSDSSEMYVVAMGFRRQGKV